MGKTDKSALGWGRGGALCVLNPEFAKFVLLIFNSAFKTIGKKKIGQKWARGGGLHSLI